MALAKKTPLFHRAHYNILAAQIKRELAKHSRKSIPQAQRMYARNALIDLALSLAKRLQQDNPPQEGTYSFDPLKFLDACSPDPEQYPISELWFEVKAND